MKYSICKEIDIQDHEVEIDLDYDDIRGLVSQLDEKDLEKLKLCFLSNKYSILSITDAEKLKLFMYNISKISYYDIEGMLIHKIGQ